MAWDNYTPTKVRALKECPQGHQPGDVFEVTRDAAEVLKIVGAVEIMDGEDDAPKTNGTRPPNPPAGRHNRRDQRAEE